MSLRGARRALGYMETVQCLPRVSERLAGAVEARRETIGRFGRSVYL
jgi:hypothetical protein